MTRPPLQPMTPGRLLWTKQVCYPLGLIVRPSAPIMRPVYIRPYYGLLSIFMTGLMLGCHSTPPVTEGYPHQQALQGKTLQQVLACAGPPLQKREDGPAMVLRYYKEAPLLEESMVSSKGSRPTVHHGCWATVIFENQRVERVRYHFVPSSMDASNDCEEIFANCQE